MKYLLTLIAFCWPLQAFSNSTTVNCGSMYVVQPGDSLSGIARAVNGSFDAWKQIYDSNRRVIGSDPNLLETGTTLVIPCTAASQPNNIRCTAYHRVQRGDTLSSIAAARLGAPTDFQRIVDVNRRKINNPDLLQIGTELNIPPCRKANSDSNPVTSPKKVPVRLSIITGDNYAPFVGSKLPQGGYSTELVTRALLGNNGLFDFRIDTNRTWANHLRQKLNQGGESGRYDLAFPWFRPGNCNANNLGEESLFRCRELLFSEPLHEVLVTYHTHPQLTDRIKAESDMRGLRICRPKGYFTHDLEAMGLAPDTYTRVAPDEPNDCFFQLIAGTVDVATVNARTAHRVITQHCIQDKVAALPFRTLQTLHVVGRKSNPSTAENLQRINAGLAALEQSGEILEVESRHSPQTRDGC